MSDDAGHGEMLEVADIQKVMEVLPHRYPFLMIDKVIKMKDGVSGTGIKNVTINEQFFQGHFAGNPVMPGVLMIEAMAQTAITIVACADGIDTKDKVAFFMSIDNARFRKPVVPGDQLEIPVELVKKRGNVWKFHGEAFVEGALACEAHFAAIAIDTAE